MAVTRKTRLSVVLTVFLLSNASAQPDLQVSSLFELSFEELLELEVSIATGTSVSRHQAPAVTSVITATDIKAMGATELAQVMAMIPGLHVYPNTVGRMETQFSIRGIHTDWNPQVLLLLNGQNISSIFTGARISNFHLPVADISRVEVIRGPGSALYGADAFAGVINIITKSAHEIDGTRFGARAGSFNTQDMWLQQSAKLGHWDFTFSLETLRTQGDPGRIIDTDFQTQLDGSPEGASYAPGPLSTNYNVTNSYISLSNQRWDIGLWHWKNSDAGVGQGAAQILDPNGVDQSDTSMLNITRSWKNLTDDWDLSANYNVRYTQLNAYFVLFPPGATVHVGDAGNLFNGENQNPITFTEGVIGSPQALGHKNELNVVADYKGFKQHHVRLGIGISETHTEGTSRKNFGPGVITDNTISPVDGDLTYVPSHQSESIYVDPQVRKLAYLWLQDQWFISGNWTFTSGIRFDDYNHFGDTINPRLALVHTPSPKLTTKLLYGSAFRAPGINEMYYKNNPSTIGSADLVPETIDTVELAFEHRSSDTLNSSLNIYRYQIKDLIEGALVDSSVISQNVRDQDGYGFELASNWQTSPELRIRGYYSWQHSEDADTGERRAEAPRRLFYLSSLWAFAPEWQLGAQAKWISDRSREATDSRPKLGDYTLVDFTLRKENIFPNAEFAVGVHNAFNDDAREPSLHNDSLATGAGIPNDLPMEGRSIFAELSYHFQ